jgi:antitoxin YefM
MSAMFTEDVHPVSTLRRKAHEVVRQTRRTGRPILITQRGRPAAVLVSAEEWDRLKDRLEMLGEISLGEQDFAQGRVVEEDDARQRLLRAATTPAADRPPPSDSAAPLLGASPQTTRADDHQDCAGRPPPRPPNA